MSIHENSGLPGVQQNQASEVNEKNNSSSLISRIVDFILNLLSCFCCFSDSNKDNLKSHQFTQTLPEGDLSDRVTSLFGGNSDEFVINSPQKQEIKEDAQVVEQQPTTDHLGLFEPSLIDKFLQQLAKNENPQMADLTNFEKEYFPDETNVDEICKKIEFYLKVPKEEINPELKQLIQKRIEDIKNPFEKALKRAKKEIDENTWWGFDSLKAEIAHEELQVGLNKLAKQEDAVRQHENRVKETIKNYENSVVSTLVYQISEKTSGLYYQESKNFLLACVNMVKINRTLQKSGRVKGEDVVSFVIEQLMEPVNNWLEKCPASFKLTSEEQQDQKRKSEKKLFPVIQSLLLDASIFG